MPERSIELGRKFHESDIEQLDGALSVARRDRARCSLEIDYMMQSSNCMTTIASYTTQSPNYMTQISNYITP